MPELPLRIRPATGLDAEVLAGLAAHTNDASTACVERSSALAEPADFLTTLNDPGPDAHWIGVLGDKAVAWLHVRALGPGQPRALEVVDIRVLPDQRRRGIGTALMMYAIADAPALARVTPGHEARAFFHSLNFFDDDADLLLR